MNAEVDDNLLTVEIDGRELKAPKGTMLIQVADQAGIPIPRFCYHPKLAIAANCRMCLVEVEMGGKPAPKPLPACATPIADGMKVQTRSDKALSAQRNVMEFLLINHPLDCPICDQGGECELQDLSLGYGRGVTRFTERKRNVADEDIGPLVETFMTRCIHCTRCVRVLDEIAGTQEFGGMNRSEHLEIGTYIGKSVESELSGNIIDVCPVGALTDKVFKFQARAWELVARESLGYHDALGSNLWLHVRHGKIMRAVPRDNDAINECWLSDRDRYSHQGLYHDERAAAPMIKRSGEWMAASWEDALQVVADGLQQRRGSDLGILAHAATSCEEGLLLGRLADGLDCPNIDHRLRQLDVPAGPAPAFEMPVEDIADVGATLLVGSYLRHELPLVNHRLRDSVVVRPGVRHPGDLDSHERDQLIVGGQVFVVSSVAQEFNYPLAGSFIAPPQSLVDELLTLASAARELADDGVQVDARLAAALADVEVDGAARTAIKALADADKSLVMFGHMAAMHPEAGWLRAAARLIASATGSAFNEVPMGANSIGLDRAGVLPRAGGLDARGMQTKPRKAYVVFGAEPPHDFVDGKQVTEALEQADFVVACNAWASPELKRLADVILPIAPLPMTPATLVNVGGRVQTVGPAVEPVAETMPEYRAAASRMEQPVLPAGGQVSEGWKVLRSLGRQLGLDGFDISAFEDFAELVAALADAPAATVPGELPERARKSGAGLVRVDSIPIYRGDAVLRRATALNDHPLTRPPEAVLAPADAKALDLAEGDTVRIDGNQELPLRIDARVPAGSVWIQSTHDATSKLAPMGATLAVEKA